MIKLPEIRETDFSSISKKVYSCKTHAELLAFYEQFINNYLQLNQEYKFSEYFDKSFVYKQIENLISFRSRPLYGIPFGIKDVFNTKVLPTAMGSKIWEGFNAGNNARIVDEIADRGGIIFSKTTTAEFAVHYIDNGKTINPYNSQHITGTSSAGSAVAVACGALPIALGTQTGGSIIRPASFCNVFGFKPSFGAIDRTGALKTTDPLDTIGFLGSDIYGLRKTFLATFQKETESNYYANNYFKYYERYKAKPKLKVGIVAEAFAGYDKYESYVKDDLNDLVKYLPAEDITFKMVDGIEFINEIHALHEIIYCKSLSYYFKDESTQVSDISEVMLKMIEMGNKISEQDYVAALREQPKYRERFNAIIGEYDFLITPSTASVAPVVGEREKDDTCLIWTFLGYPVLNLPIFWSEKYNLPYGLQIIAPKFGDLSVFDFGEMIIKRLEEYLQGSGRAKLSA